MNQPNLTTKRLLLRAFHLDDSDDVERLAGNENVSKQTLNIPHPYEPGMAAAWIATHVENWNARNRITYAVTDIESNELIGTAGFVSNKGHTGELGYWIGESFWGKGYCTEAVCELIRFAFTVLDLDRVIAKHLTTNPASGKVMLKAGMRYIETVYHQDRYQKYVSLEKYEICKNTS